MYRHVDGLSENKLKLKLNKNLINISLIIFTCLKMKN